MPQKRCKIYAHFQQPIGVVEENINNQI